MIESLNSYFQTFLKPNDRSRSEEERVSYFEVMGISWSLHIVYAFYSIFAIYLGIKSYEYLSSSADFTHLLFDSINVTFQKISLMMTLFEVIFYPFVFHFGFRFWVFILKFYAQIFEYNGPRSLDTEVEELLNSIFTTNIFLIIPIFGNVLSILAMAYYLFIGLRKRLDFTATQAFLVLLTPLFLVFLFTILVASYITFLISLM